MQELKDFQKNWNILIVEVIEEKLIAQNSKYVIDS